MAQTEPETEEYWRDLRRSLVGALSLYLGDVAVAEELAHDAVVRAIERWDRVGVMENPQGWVHVVGFNLARSRFRRIAAERRARSRLAVPVSDATGLDAAMSVAVRHALQDLAPRPRQATICRYFLDMTIDDTARTMGCAPATVKVHLRVALRALRDANLQSEEDEADD